ncbi:uncharacterized protein LOC124259774 [Haliotis rubra]|uniref:uncharacterized protein LOC124259774 n=1 Tax=Haliotis rubra TaxID=36100 RepID=UPI001EE53A99|nr:uncharacterized protein LOC124259774 [Haliotis rubra]
MKSDIHELREDINTSKQEQDVMKLDVEALNDRTVGIEKYLEELDTKLEDQEQRSRRNNVVLYNVPESGQRETYTESKDKVLTVLNKARVVKNLPPLVPRDIERAHRLSTKKGDKARPIIARMCHWEDKWQSVKMRSVLKDQGWGLLTTSQLTNARNFNDDAVKTLTYATISRVTN